MINEVRVVGRLGKDPETHFTGNGKDVHNFTVATDRSWKDAGGNWKKETDWVPVVAWNKPWISESLHKGDMVYVAGRFQTRSFDGKDGQKRYVTEVVAQEVRNLSAAVKGKDGASGGAKAAEEEGQVPW